LWLGFARQAAEKHDRVEADRLIRLVTERIAEEVAQHRGED
jgi:hypothetical protein